MSWLPRGVLITRQAGKWCVNFRGGTDATAFATETYKMFSLRRFLRISSSE
jgi:hypothetical protein